MGLRLDGRGGRLQVMVTLCDWRGVLAAGLDGAGLVAGVHAGAAGQAVLCGCGRFSLAELRGSG